MAYSSLLLMVSILSLVTSYSVIQLYKKQLPKMELDLQYKGIEMGQLFPFTNLNSINGEQYQLSREAGTGTIVIIASTTCHACKLIITELAPFKQLYPQINIVLLMAGDEQDISSIVSQHRISIPVIPLSYPDAMVLKANVFPFGYFISPEGKVVGKGVTSIAPHLHLLLEAGRSA